MLGVALLGAAVSGMTMLGLAELGVAELGVALLHPQTAHNPSFSHAKAIEKAVPGLSGSACGRAERRSGWRSSTRYRG